MMEKKLKLDFPLTRTHCGIVMGNGNLGALVWGIDKLHVTVNRADFWDHRGGELIVEGTTYKGLVEVARTKGTGNALSDAIPRYKFDANVFKPQRLPVGRFEFSFAEGVKPVSGTLDYASGTVSVELSNKSKILLDLGLFSNVMVIRDASKAIKGVECKPSWDFPNAQEWLEKYAFKAPERLSTQDLKGWAIACPADPSLASVCARRKDGFGISLELGKDNAAAFEAAKGALAKIDAAKLLKDNRKWWGAYWKDSAEIAMPDPFYNRFYKYALYKFAAATHPAGYACGLQGPWHEEYKRAEWSGDYHFNVNVQEVYSLAFPIGRLENLLPLFNMIESKPFMESLRKNSKTMFGIDDGLWFTHAVDDRGWQCGWLVSGAILDPACGAWTALLYWNYYKYSGDKEFLKNRAMPFIKGIMRCYEEMLEDRDGKLSIPLGISAEFGSSNSVLGFQQAGSNPSYQLAAMHMLANALIEGSEALGEKPKELWFDVKRRLPKFSIFKGPEAYGKTEKRIAIWDGQDLDVCHRHHSHLGCLYPFDSLPDELTEEEKEIIDNSLDQWIMKGFGQWSEWCIPWAAILQSRAGFHEAPDMLFKLWREIFVNEGLATVYIPRSRGIIAHRRHDLAKPKESTELIQLDGTMGAAIAFLEMLVLKRGSTVKLFQGVPEKWKDVSFKNVRLPEGFMISAALKDGKLAEVKVSSKSGGKLKLEANGLSGVFEFKAGEERSLI